MKWTTSWAMRRIERVVLERERPRRSAPDVDLREAQAGGLDERLRRIHGGHVVGADPVDEDRRERARAAPDVEHPLAAARRPRGPPSGARAGWSSGP